MEQVGSYRLVRRIGAGGMGEVWLGEHVVSRGIAAVKRLSRAAAHDPVAAALFAREARAVARLAHPHIVGLFEYGPDHLATAFIDGGSLARRMATPLDAASAIAIARQIAGALAHAHDRGVIHRDVKPSNILLDAHGTAFLADFGVAALGDDPLDGVVGTPMYMAPEQRRSHAVTPAADQYGLARVVIELLSGAVAATDPGPALATLPPPLRAVLARATDADPAARYPSVAAFADALAAVDLGDHAPAVPLAPARRDAGPFAWTTAAHRREVDGVDLVRSDYRLTELAARGLVDRDAVTALLDRAGLSELGFATWMATPRLGDPASPDALARVRDVVVLLHGWAQTRDAWKLTARAVCRDNALAVVIAPDVHGFGETTFVAPPSREHGQLAAIPRCAVELQRVLGLAAVPTVLVGHSMSGMGLLARTDRDFLATTCRVAINPILVTHNAALRRELARYAVLSRWTTRLGPVRRTMVKLGARRGPTADLTPDEQAHAIDTMLAMPPAVAARLLDAFAHAPFTIGPQPRLALIANVDDPWIPPDEVLDRVVAELEVPRAQVHRMASGGHLPHLESATNPEGTARNLDELVRVINAMIVTAHESAGDEPTAASSGETTAQWP